MTEVFVRHMHKYEKPVINLVTFIHDQEICVLEEKNVAGGNQFV